MPITKSAEKRLRQSLAARVRNQAARTRIKTLRRKFMESLAGADAEARDKAYRAYCAALDTAGKKGVIKANTAARRKTRAANRLRAVV